MTAPLSPAPALTAEEAARVGVDPAEIVRQRALGWPDFHPEDYCHTCARPNPTWFADTDQWREATHSTDDGGGILCPSCFCALWEAETGKTAIIWRLSIDPRSRDARAVLAAQDAEPAPEPVAHNHTRFRNDAGPWNPCPVSCPAAGLLR